MIFQTNYQIYWFWLLIISHTLIVLIINFCPISMQQEITFVNYCVQEHSDPKHLESSLELQKNTTVMAQLLQYRCTITRKKKRTGAQWMLLVFKIAEST